MSSYYRPETQLFPSSNAYLVVGSMNCSLDMNPLGGQQCNKNELVFSAMPVGIASVAPTATGNVLIVPAAGGAVLASAYPNTGGFSQIYRQM